MTEALLALVPSYGLILVFGSVLLACLGLPMPASILVLTAGAFAAAENFALWQVLATTFVAYTIGDQLAFLLGRRLGGPLIGRLKSWPRFAPMVDRSASMVAQRGSWAVLASHTILAQIGPYVTYICGANRMPWARFSCAALMGALIWSLVYGLFGYFFATQLTQIMSVMASFAWLILAVAAVVFLGFRARNAWRNLSD